MWHRAFMFMCCMYVCSRKINLGIILAVSSSISQSIYFIYQCKIYTVHLYSNPDQSGSFSTEGITQLSTTNSTFVQCNSNHLTSFAVLVDTSKNNVST